MIVYPAPKHPIPIPSSQHATSIGYQVLTPHHSPSMPSKRVSSRRPSLPHQAHQIIDHIPHQKDKTGRVYAVVCQYFCSDGSVACTDSSVGYRELFRIHKNQVHAERTIKIGVFCFDNFLRWGIEKNTCTRPNRSALDPEQKHSQHSRQRPRPQLANTTGPNIVRRSARGSGIVLLDR